MGVWHWLIVLIVIAMIALPVALIYWLGKRSGRREAAKR
jgi:4-amino-4-deoxy-L-arabinose transferase-like glycosyltransferase